jgi:hypothetical protein
MVYQYGYWSILVLFGMVAERYKFVEDALNNVLRFTNYDNKKILNHQILCEQMYWTIRRDMAKELLQLIDAGGDAYSRLANIKKVLEEQ